MRKATRAAAVLGLAGLLGAGTAAAQVANPAANPASPPKGAEEQPAQKPAPPDKFHTKGGDLRVAALIGAAIVNDQKQTIGNISDVLLDKDDKADKAVLSVGGFLGVGSRLVAVPFGNLHIDGDRIVLPGATKVSLENLSAYQAGQ